jgi:hypothetical protein
LKFITAQRIRWLGYIKRKEVAAIPRKTMEARLFRGRRKGRPRLRWIGLSCSRLENNEDKAVDEEYKKIRSNGEQFFEEARVHPDLQRREDGWMDYSLCFHVQVNYVYSKPSYYAINSFREIIA